MALYYNFTLTPTLLTNLTGQDKITALTKFNMPMAILMFIFDFVAPISLLLNMFVFLSCVAILVRKSSDRPALVFIAYNSLLDIFTTITDALVITGALNPSLAKAVILPDAKQLEERCSAEKALVSFTMFASLASVLLLTSDRFIFITKPLRYNVWITLPRSVIVVIILTLLATLGSVWYSLSVQLPWDKVCTFTHVLPLSMVIFWNALFFATWIAMHIMYMIILTIALKHKKAMSKNSSMGVINNTSIDAEATTSSDSQQVKSRLSRIRLSTITLVKDRTELSKVFKTIRYVMLLLIIYSLVELPCVTVAIDDMITHISNDRQPYFKADSECNHQDLKLVDDHTSISLLHCLQRFVEKVGDHCIFETTYSNINDLPWCAMVEATAHSLHLTRVFTIALCGWMINALADPIVYAFWYPVFRMNFVKLCFKWTDRARFNSSYLRNQVINDDSPRGRVNSVFTIDP